MDFGIAKAIKRGNGRIEIETQNCCRKSRKIFKVVRIE
jgi:hypothetical protein